MVMKHACLADRHLDAPFPGVIFCTRGTMNAYRKTQGVKRLMNRMKNRLAWCAAVICLICLPMLLVYAHPWGKQAADWSLQPEDGQEWRGDNGWTVFVAREGERVLLTPDGSGGYDGCKPGETFFFSRSWDANIAQPTLRIHAVTASVAVYMNDTLFYSDAPLAQGAPLTGLTLPPLAGERYDPVEIALYDAKAGDVLTIAQSSPLIGEKPGSTTVYPCYTEVVSAFGYERGLIASAYDVGLLCAFLGLTGILLCVLAAWQKKAALLLVALMAFVRAACVIVGTPFFSQYTLLYFIDFQTLASLLSFTLMLGFLATQLEKPRGYALALFALHGASVLGSFVIQLLGIQSGYTFAIATLPERLTPVVLLGELALCWPRARKGNDFCRLFFRAFAVGLGLWVIGESVWLWNDPPTWTRLISGQMFYARFLREPLIWLAQGAALVTVLIRAYRSAVAAQEERVFATLRAKAVQESYENLRAHQNEVMMLRHEINRHYTALKGLIEQGQTQRADKYLDELLSQQASIPKVVDSANELVNIILNSRVAWAESNGLRVEIDHMNVPEQLPLSDADAASLLLNIMDNAIEAAKDAEKQPGVIRLNMNCKNGYFTFSCENTIAVREKSKEKSPYHGYGLHIIQRIMAPYGKLMTVRREEGLHGITIALPLSHTFSNEDASAMNGQM